MADQETVRIGSAYSSLPRRCMLQGDVPTLRPEGVRAVRMFGVIPGLLYTDYHAARVRAHLLTSAAAAVEVLATHWICRSKHRTGVQSREREDGTAFQIHSCV